MVSCECLLGKEAGGFLKHLSMKLVEKWHHPYSQTGSFVKTRFTISLVRAKDRCFRGSNDWDDGARLGLYSTLE